MSYKRILTPAGEVALGAFVTVCILVAAYSWCWIAQEAMSMLARYFG
jgi:hypothetical protein